MCTYTRVVCVFGDARLHLTYSRNIQICSNFSLKDNNSFSVIKIKDLISDKEICSNQLIVEIALLDKVISYLLIWNINIVLTMPLSQLICNSILSKKSAALSQSIFVVIWDGKIFWYDVSHGNVYQLHSSETKVAKIEHEI